LLAGCSSNGDWAAGGIDSQGAGAPKTAEVQEKAQFADATLLNLVDPLAATISVTADGNPVTVQIFYSGDKTTDTGRTAAAPVLVDTLTLATDQTGTHNVNLLNSAFNGGYGSVFLNSIGSGPLDVFQTYVQYGGSIFSAGGNVFQGGSYRIPYLSGTLRMVLVITNQSNFAFNIQFANIGHTDLVNVNLVPFSTYKFDSFAERWNMSGTNSVQITTTGGGTVALSGYIDRLLQRQRIAPVKAAPFN
jgi:hypothetical protein